jgi:hypothetical protein
MRNDAQVERQDGQQERDGRSTKSMRAVFLVRAAVRRWKAVVSGDR